MSAEDQLSAAHDPAPSAQAAVKSAPPPTEISAEAAEPWELKTPTNYVAEDNEGHEEMDYVKDEAGEDASPEGVAQVTIAAQAEEKKSSDGSVSESVEVAEVSGVVDDNFGADARVGEQEDVVTDGHRRSALPSEVEDESEHGGDRHSTPSSFRIDLGLEDGWFEKLEAKMGAIKKQVCMCVRSFAVSCCVIFVSYWKLQTRFMQVPARICFGGGFLVEREEVFVG